MSNAKKKQPNEVQVIMVKKEDRKLGPDWSLTLHNVKTIEHLAEKIDKALNELAHDFTILNDKIKEAYQAAPETDSGLTSSPLGPSRVSFAMRVHLHKKGLRYDKYLGNLEKRPLFKDFIKEGVFWLIKSSMKE